jgi:hypothetical protein
MDEKEWENYQIARLVARWILEGKPNREKPETRAWLVENGYGDLLDEKEEGNG